MQLEKSGLMLCSPGTVGAVAELEVSIDLMRQGYEVFRALSPSCSCDLLALKGKKAFRFEIRTGRRRKGKEIPQYPMKNIRAENVVAVTHADRKLHYMGELVPMQP